MRAPGLCAEFVLLDRVLQGKVVEEVRVNVVRATANFGNKSPRQDTSCNWPHQSSKGRANLGAEKDNTVVNVIGRAIVTKPLGMAGR